MRPRLNVVWALISAIGLFIVTSVSGILLLGTVAHRLDLGHGYGPIKPTNTYETPPPASPVKDVAIVGCTYDSATVSASASIRIINHTHLRSDYRIVLGVYDASGARLGSASTDVKEVHPEETVRQDAAAHVGADDPQFPRPGPADGFPHGTCALRRVLRQVSGIPMAFVRFAPAWHDFTDDLLGLPRVLLILLWDAVLVGLLGACLAVAGANLRSHHNGV